MIEYLNKVFGIENEISAPILISIIVVIIGGLGSVLLKNVLNYFSRLQTRKSFRIIVKEIQKKSQQQSKYILAFYNTLDIHHKGDWRLKFTRVTYLDLIYQQDFSNIYNSFRLLFTWRSKKKVRFNAFNKIWSIIELLKFIESNIIIEFREFMNKFNQYETKFYNHLDELRKLNDHFFKPYRGKRILKDNFQNEDIFTYIVSRADILKKWEANDISVRKQRCMIMKEVVRPLHELNKNKTQIEGAMELNNLLLNVILEYEQMENLISVNRKIFNNYFWNYKSSTRLLKKSLEIIE